MIATALARKEVDRAIRYAEGLFPDSQHPIDDEVMSATKNAIDLWKSGDTALAHSQLEKALQTAARHYYV